MRRLILLIVSFLLVTACTTRERHLRSHPAVFAEPHDNFVVLVPFNRAPAPAPADGKKSPVKVASLAPPPAAPADEERGNLTRLLHEFRKSEESYPQQDNGDLLEKIAKGYSADVAAVRFRCVDTERADRTLRHPKPDPGQDRCTYISADLRDLLAIPSASVQPAERNDLIHMLLNTSDFNCSNFLVRAFAKKTNMDSRRNTLKDIGTGLTTIMASPAPALAAGLGLTNLVTGSAVDNYNASFYLEKTFQVMESAIGKERATVRQRITANMKKNGPEYPLYAALNDVRSYDDACSIERGLAVLSEMAAVQKNEAEKGLNKEVNPDAETKRELSALLAQLNTTIEQSARNKDLFATLTKERERLETALRRMTDEDEEAQAELQQQQQPQDPQQ